MNWPSRKASQVLDREANGVDAVGFVGEACGSGSNEAPPSRRLAGGGRCGNSVVVSGLEKVDPFVGDEVHDSMFLRQTP